MNELKMDVKVKLTPMEDGYFIVIQGQDEYVGTVVAIDEKNVAIIDVGVVDINKIIKALEELKKRLKS